jgi:hypothetical protein
LAGSFGGIPYALEKADPLPSLFDLVQFEDGGDPRRRLALAQGLEQLVNSPTGGTLAQEFGDLGLGARLAFGRIEGTRAVIIDGRPGFHGPRGYTTWHHDHPLVILNDHYLTIDPIIRERELPATLGHELLGHGLWYHRAQAKKLLDVFHLHELNEVNARLVGWTIEMELHDGLGDREAWHFLRDREGYLAEMKLRHPYYALTYNADEMKDALASLIARIPKARARLAEQIENLKRHRSWYRVIDHFIMVHYMDHNSFTALQGYMKDTDGVIFSEIEQARLALNAMIKAAQTLHGEADRQSARYLARKAQHTLFADLQKGVDLHSTRLEEQVEAQREKAKKGKLNLDSAMTRHWEGQVTFEQLVSLYENDHDHFNEQKSA